MLYEQVRQEQARHDDGPEQGPFRFEVLISSNGSAALNGARLSAAEGQEIHVAILDEVHRAARARGEPVEVTILDLRENGYATHIRVAPDGSSQLIEPGTEPAATPTPSPPEPVTQPPA
ncbi:hypothetical protein ITI46_30590, partial [Streptomyces oryzae]|nr:hypothetical protein [Streptomyces oryzae]